MKGDKKSDITIENKKKKEKKTWNYTKKDWNKKNNKRGEKKREEIMNSNEKNKPITTCLLNLFCH